jgi:pilus assembly protein CpaE
VHRAGEILRVHIRFGQEKDSAAMLRKFTSDAEELDRIQLVTGDAALALKLQETLARTQRFELETMPGSIEDAERQGIANSHPAILLVELDPANAQDMGAMERVMHQRAPGLPVIIISDKFSENSARDFMRLNVSDWCPKQSVGTDLLQACERALQSSQAQTSASEASCYAFVPAAGGIGNTTLAIQSAFLLARKNKQFQSTCLIALDFQTGSIADYLDLTPNLQLEEIISEPERLDEQLMEVMLSRHETGIAVLAAENSLRDYNSINADLITRMLDMASAKFDNVVIDMPRVWLPWSSDVLEGCDKAFVVTEMTVPGLRAASRLIDAINEKCGDEVDTSVLVNRCRTSLIGGGINSLRRSDAEDMLGTRLGGFVFEDYRLVREAIDRGVPLYEIKKGNKIDKDLTAILFPKTDKKKKKKKKK